MITTIKQLAKVVPEVCSTRIISEQKKYRLVITTKKGDKFYEMKRELVMRLIRSQTAYPMNILVINQEKLRNSIK